MFFLLTVVSMLYVGSAYGLDFWGREVLEDPTPVSALEMARRLVVYGAPFCFTALAIMFAHEMGHYVTSRRYRVDSTLPFFIPFPLSLFGTFGAFILIKSRFPNRRALIDIGLAGPFAGFLVTLPALAVGLSLSKAVPIAPAGGSISLGEPLLFRWFEQWFGPVVPEGQLLYTSPVALAAWFGLLLTALNLFPVGQLDGGHAAYAVLKQKAHRLSTIAFLAFLPLSYFGPSWVVWTIVLFAFGIRRPHPPTEIDEMPLPRSRVVMAVIALVVFVLCFTPTPIEVRWADLWSSP